MLDEVVGDAEHQRLFRRIAIRQLQNQAMLGERLVGDWRRRVLRHDLRRTEAERRKQRTNKRAARARYHPMSAMPGLLPSPFSTTRLSRLGRAVFCLRSQAANTSDTGLPSCGLTDAHPATLYVLFGSSVLPPSSVISEMRLPMLWFGAQA